MPCAASKRWISPTVFGVPAVTDIIKGWKNRARSASEFKTATFAERHQDRHERSALPGMLLEGAVTNVTNFGAFVDIGVHQDASSISSLADKFVEDPHREVEAGDIAVR